MANIPILHPLKTLQHLWFFGVFFSGGIKWEHDQKWVNFQVINNLQVTAHGPNHHQYRGIMIINFLTNVDRLIFSLRKNNTAQKMKFSIKYFLSKCDQIRRKLRIWLQLLKKSLLENFIFRAV